MHTPIGMAVFQSSRTHDHYLVHPLDQVISNKSAVIFVAVADMYGDNDKVTLTYTPDDPFVMLSDKMGASLPHSPTGTGQVQEAMAVRNHPFAYARFKVPSVVNPVVVNVIATFSDGVTATGKFTIVATMFHEFKRHHRFKKWHRHGEIEARYRR